MSGTLAKLLDQIADALVRIDCTLERQVALTEEAIAQNKEFLTIRRAEWKLREDTDRAEYRRLKEQRLGDHVSVSFDTHSRIGFYEQLHPEWKEVGK